ncbi:hypothetical protein NZK35_23105 [Stieleria sp. ICT_E10.1]|uniref:hypothetical protein n=1 Tax=Stieleria sedimenti TaxID=2976331 RepID=UPI00217FB7A2|nr:hypothetical protein [Stieleria sedimenti]MCS7469551.1 hypothetical protein [Stieleria sedimenti]
MIDREFNEGGRNYDEAIGEQQIKPSDLSRTTTTGWWRWIILPVAAPASAIIATILISILGEVSIRLTNAYEVNGWVHNYGFPLMASGVFGFVWCFTSSFVAPTGKVLTGAIMATVLAMIGVFLSAVTFASPDDYSTSPYLMVASAIATLVGSVAAVMQVASSEKQ